MKKRLKKRKYIGLGVLILIFIIIAVAGFTIIPQIIEKQEDHKEVITVSTLEKIINVSELSTFIAIYNGVTPVMNEEKPEQIDYYVSYEATVKAGIDFDKVNINKDDEEKVIRITLPPAYITEINVDIASLDYIFLNDKANTSSVSQEAYKACEVDVENESNQQGEIIEFATENAKNILTALIKPIMEQVCPDYTLEIE